MSERVLYTVRINGACVLYVGTHPFMEVDERGITIFNVIRGSLTIKPRGELVEVSFTQQNGVYTC